MNKDLTTRISPLDDGLTDVVHEAYVRSFTVKSDYARNNAAFVAMAASLGLISTRVTKGVYSFEWRPTGTGLALLRERDELEEDE